jgi:hypothetical protein
MIPVAKSLVFFLVWMVVATGGAEAGETKSGDAFVDVKIVNECGKDVEARFVMPKPGEDEAALGKRIRETQITVLPGGKTTVRKMKPKEQLVILFGQDGSVSQSFETRERALKSDIFIGADCSSIGSRER